MTNKEIFEKANITISESGVPSRTEQRKAARDALEGVNPATLAELFYLLKGKGFGVNFGVKLYKSGSDFVNTYNEALHYVIVGEGDKKEEHLVMGRVNEGEAYIYHQGEAPTIKEIIDGEAAYTHAKVFFSYVQNAAIRYKAASLKWEEGGNSKKSKEYTTMCERRTALYDSIKEFCAEALIERKCKAADAESISTFAAKFTYKGERITEGVKYAPTSLTAFAMAFMRYIAADIEGIDTTENAINNRLARLAK